MLAEQRFWRLLADYEQLTRDEAAALRARDFDKVSRGQKSKAALLGELPALAAAVGLNCRETTLAGRLDALIRAEEENREATSALLHTTRSKHPQLAGARRLSCVLGAIYGPEAAGLNLGVQG